MYSFIGSEPENVLSKEQYAVLTESEQLFSQRFNHETRREQWITGRVLLKNLLLQKFHEQDFARTDVAFSFICKKEFRDFPKKLYRRLEILPEKQNEEKKFLLPRWNGSLLPVHCAVSHKQGIGTFAFCGKQNCGIDIELVSQRKQSFYKHNFSALERQWLEQQSLWTYDQSATLLWTLKECFLKSYILPDFSLIRFPELTVFFVHAQQNNANGSYYLKVLFQYEKRAWTANVHAEISDKKVLSILFNIQTDIDRNDKTFMRYIAQAFLGKSQQYFFNL